MFACFGSRGRGIVTEPNNALTLGGPRGASEERLSRPRPPPRLPDVASYPSPARMVHAIIDNLLDNIDLRACSLVSRSWSCPANNRLFHCVRVCPGEVEDWLSRPPESVQRMALHIVKFELLQYRVELQHGEHR